MLLVGCSAGGAGGGAKPADKSLFTGTWDLVRMSGDKPDDNLGEDDVELMRSMGFDVFLNLNEDDTMELALFGSTMRGSWKVKSAAEIEVTLEGQSVSATLSGEELTLSQEGTSMMFKKGKENKHYTYNNLRNEDTCVHKFYCCTCTAVKLEENILKHRKNLPNQNQKYNSHHTQKNCRITYYASDTVLYKTLPFVETG